MLLAVSRSWLLHLSSGLLSCATWHSMHSCSLCPVSSGYGQASFRQVRGFRLRYLKAAVTDYKMYLGMLIYMGCDMPLYAFSLFLPSILAELGYTSAKAQLFTVPSILWVKVAHGSGELTIANASSGFAKRLADYDQ